MGSWRRIAIGIFPCGLAASSVEKRRVTTDQLCFQADHWTQNRTDESEDEDVLALAPETFAATGPRSRKKPLRLRDDPDRDTRAPPRPARAAAAQSKSARAHSKVYTSGPPLVPHLIVRNLMEYIKRIIVRKKLPLVERICRYWSLKREARRGAPLLKRLHLEVRQAGV